MILSVRTGFVSERAYRKLTALEPDGMKAVRAALGGKDRVVGRYTCNIVNDLKVRGDSDALAGFYTALAAHNEEALGRGTSMHHEAAVLDFVKAYRRQAEKMRQDR